ncbi:TonB-dependent receptor plug domain-containing protein [Citromicrobium bathyomarinum]|uniref:TonB-dependent receptor plug domain-containing protein n=1 Tax=Citromicrobium bathyomarinum TaxID=72174 RepID=UPI003159C5F6
MARASLAALLAASTSHIAYAQDASGDAPPPGGTVVIEPDGSDEHVYTPEDFARFKPNTALDMLEQVPGFQISQQNQGRGLGQASENVLINGERIASKSDSAVDRLSRTSAARVQRIEIVDGASFGIPGLSGQVANVIIETGAISGNFRYNLRVRPEYAAPSWGSGEVSLSGASGNIEWNGAFQLGSNRGGAGGRPGVRIYDADDNLLETRRILIKNVGEYPRVRGGLKWNGPGSMVATINAD